MNEGKMYSELMKIMKYGLRVELVPAYYDDPARQERPIFTVHLRINGFGRKAQTCVVMHANATNSENGLRLEHMMSKGIAEVASRLRDTTEEE